MEEWFENLFGGIDTMLTRIGAETHAQVPTTQVLIRRNIPGQPDRMYLPGEWDTTLPPAKAMKTDTWLSIEARVQTIGHYVITWQPDIQNLHHYRNPEPLAELTKLWQANPRLVFEDYAPLFGIKILRVDPPQEGTTKAARDATKWIRESADSLSDLLLAPARTALPGRSGDASRPPSEEEDLAPECVRERIRHGLQPFPSAALRTLHSRFPPHRRYREALGSDDHG